MTWLGWLHVWSVGAVFATGLVFALWLDAPPPHRQVRHLAIDLIAAATWPLMLAIGILLYVYENW